MTETLPFERERDTDVGAWLRRWRQQRGYSQRQVAVAITVPVDQLRALEANDLSVFRAEVFAQGVFRRYMQFLRDVDDLNENRQLEQTIERAWQRLVAEQRLVGAGVDGHWADTKKQRVLTSKTWLDAWFTPQVAVMGGLGLICVLLLGYVSSQIWTFVAVPRLVLEHPMELVVKNESLLVQGQTNQASTITVNEASVVVDDAGLFSTTLVLHPGINVISVVARNGSGRIKEVRKTVLMSSVL